MVVCMESENAVPLPDSNRFPAKMRLIGSEFERVYKAKCSVSDGVLIVYAVANELGFSRLGLTVSRKVGPAHQRNRWKRSIREAFRTRLSALPIGFDYVVLPRSPVQPKLTTVQRSLTSLAQRAVRKCR